MSDPSTQPCVLVVADEDRAAELIGALSEPLPTAVVSRVEVLVSTGGDDTIDLFAARKPHVVVVTASLDAGDPASLVASLRNMVPRAEVGVVVIGDANGPIKSVADAHELAPDRFVARPLVPRTLRFAVASALEAVMLVRGPVAPLATGTAPDSNPAIGHALPMESIDDDPTESNRAAIRARWEALADSLVDGIEPDDDEPTRDRSAASPSPTPPPEADPLPPPVIIRPRRQSAAEPPQAWKPGTTDGMVPWAPPEAPAREPTLIIPDPEPGSQGEAPRRDEPGERFRAASQGEAIDAPLASRTSTHDPPTSRTKTGDSKVDIAERAKAGSPWSEPMPLAALLDHPDRRGRDFRRELDHEPPVRDSADDLAAALINDDFDHDLLDDEGKPRTEPSRLEVLDDLPDAPPASSSGDGRDFARQLRAKMSMMAQRLFQGTDAASAPAPADLAPRHDHHTEIDLASLGEELPLAAHNTEIESRANQRPSEPRDVTTSPGSWDTQVRERGLPDGGELVRGISDAALLLAKMFIGGATGRLRFRRDDVEKIVFFDQGRPVFASSSEPRDRMGELLVREGKITAAQYERCQTVVAESGRRMGEILVDFGYLKRRELLPAVRRHVEDIVYSLFGWDRGQYQIMIEKEPCAERIRLSRHPAAIVLEGIRRKLDRTSLERLVGPPSTVIEVSDRERLGAVINTGDLAPEERASLAAIDGQADLSTVARIAGLDVADILPLAWGLVVLGLANARRTDTEIPEESTALVGETDLAIDRERVRARWQLVTEADYFALLGVRRDATTFEIRRAYQAARRDFALDSFPSDLRRELAQELDDIANVLDEAFRVLRDDRLRRTYLTNLVE